MCWSAFFWKNFIKQMIKFSSHFKFLYLIIYFQDKKMKPIFSVCLTILITAVFQITLCMEYPTYSQYVQTFKKIYNDDEYAKHKQIYEGRIRQFAGIVQYTPGVNNMTDMTAEQIDRYRNGGLQFAPHPNRVATALPTSLFTGEVPAYLNWRQRDVITSVKDQGQCGSCWAFASIATAQSTIIINGWSNTSVDLSEQYMVQCTNGSDCAGTYNVSYAFQKILSGVPTQKQYPYMPLDSYEGICQAQQKVSISTGYKKYINISDQQIIALLQSSPVAITVSANGWQYYGSGTFACHNYVSTNHAVQIVGYTPAQWIIKNSWGTSYGEKGYIQITRSRKDSANCLVGEQVYQFDLAPCNIPGCSVCNGSFICQQCKDPLATLRSNSCTCPKGYAFNSDQFCLPCTLQNCVQCSHSSHLVCARCQPGKNLVLANGKCGCPIGNKLNQYGVCQLCNITGCNMCAPNDPNTCIQCQGCNAYLINGQCQCTPSLYELSNDTLCSAMASQQSTCSVIGCQYCSSQSPNVCIKCVDSPNTYMDGGGKCVCSWSSTQKPNKNGYCQICAVQGCASCQNSSPHACSTCLDPLAVVSQNGTCKCPDQMKFDALGMCQQCKVLMCTRCSAIDPYTCVSCAPGFNLGSDGLCRCSNTSLTINELNLCSVCSVEHCHQCQSTNANVCLKCKPGLVSNIQGYCLCPYSSQKPNQICSCAPCKVRGCISCSYSNYNFCIQCATGMNLANGACSCPNDGQLLNEIGVCEECNVPGCVSCVAGNPNICAKCAQCSTYLLNGLCVCPSSLDILSSKGQCITQSQIDAQTQSDTSISTDVNSVSFSTICSNDCKVCAQGICQQCPLSYYPYKQRCITCKLGCHSCQNASSCDECHQGWTLILNKCQVCKIRKCLQCQSQNTCTKCKPGYFLHNHECIESGLSTNYQINAYPTFQQFKQTYNKSYGSSQEELLRKKIYEQNLIKVQAIQPFVNYQIGVNWFSDSTYDETKRQFSQYQVQQPQFDSQASSSSSSLSTQVSSPKSRLLTSHPLSINWIQKGAVTSIKSQSSCGEWAYAIIALAQSTLILNGRFTNTTIDLSQAYLMHCGFANPDNCSGVNHLQDILQSVFLGIPQQSQYPSDQVPSDSICQQQAKMQDITDGYTAYYNTSDDKIIELLQNGPVIGLYSSSQLLPFYTGGIFQCQFTQLPHYLVGQIVGYGPDYWIIKNALGIGWGEQGYLKVTRNSDHNCGIGVKIIQLNLNICKSFGCKKCEATNYTKCVTCIDPTALVVNGSCNCQNGLGLNYNGHCSGCRVKGCANCSPTNSSQCLACSDNLHLVNGSCVCASQTLKVNSQGFCEQCNVAGCVSCQPGYSNICEMCKDCSAFLSNGICRCPAKYQLNSHGICQVLCNIGNCSRCSPPGTCSQCISNLVLIDGECACPAGSYFMNSACALCSQPNCGVCTSSSCTQCLIGYIFNPSNICVKCNVLGCKYCSSTDPNICQACLYQNSTLIDGRCICPVLSTMLSSGACRSCNVEHCQYCIQDDPSRCQVCKPGLTLLGSGLCRCMNTSLLPNSNGICEQCFMSGCSSCVQGNPYKCARCADCNSHISELGQCTCTRVGYAYGINKRCQPCNILNCHTFVESTCIKCRKDFSVVDGRCACDKAGYIVSDLGHCHPCGVANCVRCSLNRNSVCEMCKQLFVGANGACVCGPGYQLNVNGNCILSGQEVGYWRDTHNNTFQCSYGCTNCNQQGCYLCHSSYYLTTNRVCHPCPANCKTCHNSSTSGCISCHTGYYSNGSQCLSCSLSQHPHAVGCSSNINLMCQWGYSHVSNSCLACPTPNCMQCDSSLYCTQCSVGYGLDASGECMQCLSSCKKCNGSDVTQCLQCPHGMLYNWDAGTCQNCIQNCYKCSSYADCDVCGRGYEFNQTSQLCVSVRSCHYPCAGCADSLCTSCFAGYVLNTNNTCIESVACGHASPCMHCPYTYALVSGLCKQCLTADQNCISCDSSDLAMCTGCGLGYYLQNGQCLQCSENCSVCLANTANYCLSCKQGYYMIKLSVDQSQTGICRQCQLPCKTCIDSQDTCLTCSQDHDKIGWKCVSKRRVDFVLEIQTTMQQFIKQLKSTNTFLHQYLYNKPAPNPSSITIHSLTSGSVIVNGSAQVNSPQQANRVQNSLSSLILINDRRVIGSRTLKSGFQEGMAETKINQVDVQHNVNVLAGVASGGLALILIVGAIICYKIKKQKQTQIQNSSNSSHQINLDNTEIPIPSVSKLKSQEVSGQPANKRKYFNKLKPIQNKK